MWCYFYIKKNIKQYLFSLIYAGKFEHRPGKKSTKELYNTISQKRFHMKLIKHFNAILHLIRLRNKGLVSSLIFERCFTM